MILMTTDMEKYLEPLDQETQQTSICQPCMFTLKNRRFLLIFLNNPRELAMELLPRLSTYAHALRMSMICRQWSTLLKVPKTPKGRHRQNVTVPTHARSLPGLRGQPRQYQLLPRKTLELQSLICLTCYFKHLNLNDNPCE